MGGDFYIIEYFMSAIVFFFFVPIIMILKNDNLTFYILQRLKSYLNVFTSANTQVCPTLTNIQAWTDSFMLKRWKR